ncbi:MAG: hypothetical protein OXT67_05355 [Zetaproteobacteria bacterium]|nr:hypothetical protein [Zetaproteobacteria bacterium]
MGLFFSTEKRKKTGTRKLPFLPRVGIYIDFAGYEVVLKHVPIMETLVNINPYHLTRAKLQQVMAMQMDEVNFPTKPKEVIITAIARTIAVHQCRNRKRST